MTSVVRTMGVRRKARSGQESEARLRLFLERVPAAVAMFDTEMRYLACSQRFRTDFGIGEQEIVGCSHYELFPEIPPRWKEIHERCLAGAVERCDEDPFPRADGRVDWVRWEMQPWYSGAGRVGGLLLFAEVITERKAAELNTRAIAAHARCIIWHALVVELPGGGLHWEPMLLDEAAAQRFFPLPVGPDGSYWLAWAASRVPEDHQRMNAYGHQELRAGRSYSQEFRCQDAAGAIRWFSEDVQVDPIGPGQWRTVGVCVDVTRRRQAEIALQEREARLTGIIDSAFDAIITVDEEHRITLFNTAAAILFRCPAVQALGQPLGRFTPERHRDSYREQLEAFGRAAGTSRSTWSPGLVVGLRADREEFPLEATISQVMVGGQKLYTIILRDLSAHEQMEHALQRERNVTSTLQRAFLPDSLPECPGYRFGHSYHPALDEAMVGGDFYDVFPLSSGRRIGLLLGDVSGKGVAAAVYGTMTRHMVRAYAVETSSPGEVLSRVNRALCEVMDDPYLFVSAFYAVLDPEEDRLWYANAGHWPALLAREQLVEVIGGNGPALSIVPEASYAEGQLRLEAGDELLVFTDGLVEIEREDPMVQFEAIQKSIQRWRDEPPEQLVERLYRDALACGAGSLRDDVALLVLRCEKQPRRDRAAASTADNRAAAERFEPVEEGPIDLAPAERAQIDWFEDASSPTEE
jgi:PAS domain S-box-containing protein